MKTKYYLGLDIGTDSVGYAVTDEYYQIPKRKGEPVIGTQIFDAASGSEERRSFRSSRRRIDRVQQRVQLVNELFAPSIGKVDSRFFIRRAESRLWRDETEDGSIVFNDPDFKDKDYYKLYPTIHHLIVELMRNPEPHDVRLVYLACAWLVAHRGHFLFDVASNEIKSLTDFEKVYGQLKKWFIENESALPWDDNTSAQTIRNIMEMDTGITHKIEAFKDTVCHGKKPPKLKDDSETGCHYGADAIINLLCGKKVKPEEIFQTGIYEELDSISLTMAEEDFTRCLADLGEDAELLRKLRAMQDCIMLIKELNGSKTISEAKVGVYDQHKDDLIRLKKFVKKYLPKDYNSIFRDSSKENYTAYSYNVKSCKGPIDFKRASVDSFSDFMKKKLKDVKPQKADQKFYEDMMARLEIRTFLPKQKTTDNRVIPNQLYRYELESILSNAENYLPFLKVRDESGLTNREKLESIFTFRIPYYVGPLCRYKNDEHSWIKRKEEGKILPWNFKDKVDLDKSETEFIRRMTNTCTYLAGEPVLPQKSLLYQKFTVLNEINNLKINGNSIPVETKQQIFENLFLQGKKVTKKKIEDYLKGKGLLFMGDEISGIDEKINSTLSSASAFQRLLSSKSLSEADIEKIIDHAAFSEDKARMLHWLQKEYPLLSEEDQKYITRLNLKEFGRLSKQFLVGVYGTDSSTGEVFTIMDALWETNYNLMQLLSDKFTFRIELERLNQEYYGTHAHTLSHRLEEMYLSNAVKRPIFRTLDICDDVVKAMGCAPMKIFIEMARGSSEDKKGRRTQSRKQQLVNLYKDIKTETAKAFERELESMGDATDNRLQSEKLFLYYLQMGKCAYTGNPIDLSRLNDANSYNVEHIYPRAFVKDDSILNNKVLVDSKVNGAKGDSYPVDSSIRKKMRPIWEEWKNNGLITKEKFARLTRQTPFTEEEKWEFINRQLVETRQSTKAVAALLAEKYPNTEIVYVKAGLVSEFRQEFDLLKCRSVNNLHHAKDAYLNVVVGNVYSMRFSRQWFQPSGNYSIKTKTLFTHPVKCGKEIIWQGETDLAKVKANIQKNAIHLTKYAYCKKGGLFDQQPVKAAPGLVPLKNNLSTTKYGGYNKATASFFSLVKFRTVKKTDIVFLPIELLVAERYLYDSEFAKDYAKTAIEKIFNNPVDEAEILLNERPLKINTVLSLDGLKVNICGKSGGGKQTIVTLLSPLTLSPDEERYIKRLESFLQKREINKNILPDREHDGISSFENISLYETLTNKMCNSFYQHSPGNQSALLKNGKTKFEEADIINQVEFLMNLLMWFSSASTTINLELIDGSKKAGAKYPTSTLSSYVNKYKSVCIIDQSPSGIYETVSENLLNLL